MTAEDLKYEIEHKETLLFFTKRIIKNPPTDSVSLAMMAQADRIQAEIDALKSLIGPDVKNKKPKKLRKPNKLSNKNKRKRKK